jgi:hypothetical protein
MNMYRGVDRSIERGRDAHSPVLVFSAVSQIRPGTICIASVGLGLFFFPHKPHLPDISRYSLTPSTPSHLTFHRCGLLRTYFSLPVSSVLPRVQHDVHVKWKSSTEVWRKNSRPAAHSLRSSHPTSISISYRESLSEAPFSTRQSTFPSLDWLHLSHPSRGSPATSAWEGSMSLRPSRFSWPISMDHGCCLSVESSHAASACETPDHPPRISRQPPQPLAWHQLLRPKLSCASQTGLHPYYACSW